MLVRRNKAFSYYLSYNEIGYSKVHVYSCESGLYDSVNPHIICMLSVFDFWVSLILELYLLCQIVLSNLCLK